MSGPPDPFDPTAGRVPAVEVRDRRVVHDGWATMEVVEIATQAHGRPVVLRREIHDHGHGVAVLAYDPGRRVAVLVRQTRIPVLLVDGQPGTTLEVIAGLVDTDEGAEETARREALEEAGLRLGPLEGLGRVYASPGAVTETIQLFLAAYIAEAPPAARGGLAEEHEDLEVLEVPLVALAAAADAGRLLDLKTLYLVEALRRRRPELFS